MLQYFAAKHSYILLVIVLKNIVSDHDAVRILIEKSTADFRTNP